MTAAYRKPLARPIGPPRAVASTGMGLIAPVSAGIAAAIAFPLVLGERRGAVLIAIVTG